MMSMSMSLEGVCLFSATDPKSIAVLMSECFDISRKDWESFLTASFLSNFLQYILTVLDDSFRV